MGILLFAFLIGCVCGLRSMTAPAVVAWGAHLGWLHLDGSWLAFLANKISLVVFSLLAIGELIAVAYDLAWFWKVDPEQMMARPLDVLRESLEHAQRINAMQQVQ